MTHPTQTVGESRTLLGILLGVPRDHIRHYAIVADADDGTHLKFCCDDRTHVAAMLGRAGMLVLSERGESVNPGVEPPPMPPEVTP